MAWRVARSLDTLLAQLNKAFPNRNKISDGSIGDTNHLAEGWTDSDHNPWYPLPGGGIVTARDYTHDPVGGLDIARFSDELAASQDRRIKYIIANGFILDSRPQFSPWKWVKYTGNPHNHHLHLSVMDNLSCDDPQPWVLPMLGRPQPPTQNTKGGHADMIQLPATAVPSDPKKDPQMWSQRNFDVTWDPAGGWGGGAAWSFGVQDWGGRTDFVRGYLSLASWMLPGGKLVPVDPVFTATGGGQSILAHTPTRTYPAPTGCVGVTLNYSAPNGAYVTVGRSG
jgi:hypothetical protein